MTIGTSFGEVFEDEETFRSNLPIGRMNFFQGGAPGGGTGGSIAALSGIMTNQFDPSVDMDALIAKALALPPLRQAGFGGIQTGPSNLGTASIGGMDATGATVSGVGGGMTATGMGFDASAVATANAVAPDGEAAIGGLGANPSAVADNPAHGVMGPDHPSSGPQGPSGLDGDGPEGGGPEGGGSESGGPQSGGGTDSGGGTAEGSSADGSGED